MTDSSKRFCSDNKSGEFELPPALLEKVMSCLAVMEADGVQGPSMAARDLANAWLGPSMAARDLANTALVSSDFYNASKHGFAALEQQAAELKLRCGWEFSKPASVQCSNETLMSLQSLPRPTSWSWQQWAACLQDPLQYRVYELKQAAKQLAVPGNSSKLVTGILQAFGLQQPSSVAPQLLRAVLLERCCACPWAGCEQVSSVWDALKEWSSSDIDRKWPGLSKQLSASSCSTAAARRRALLMYTGACSKQQLQGLLFLALQKDDFSEWLRKDVQKAVEKQRKQMQLLQFT
ncbi:hypothetical protein OEZ86_008187 [Tetradesmus obliquus]|nr:hypothetical protein OEZ86_008187 [Tetradesmus obliquus]